MVSLHTHADVDVDVDVDIDIDTNIYIDRRTHRVISLGSWKTVDWQHFAERLGAYALYGSLDVREYKWTVNLFDILSRLARYAHSPSSITVLENRIIAMLIEFEEIGCKQDQTVQMHLTLEIVRQVKRWGPLLACGCTQSRDGWASVLGSSNQGNE